MSEASIIPRLAEASPPDANASFIPFALGQGIDYGFAVRFVLKYPPCFFLLLALRVSRSPVPFLSLFVSCKNNDSIILYRSRLAVIGKIDACIRHAYRGLRMQAPRTRTRPKRMFEIQAIFLPGEINRIYKKRNY